jgi:site-specific DNA-methyltransferase (adenine-specific)
MNLPINQVLCGDNVEILKRFPNESVDFILTSPPYDNARKYNGFTWDFKELAFLLYFILKEGCFLVWNTSDETRNGSESLSSFKHAIFFVEQVGFKLHDTMIAHKEGLTMNHNRYEQEFEYMFVFAKGKARDVRKNLIRVPCKWYGKDSDRTGQHNSTHNESGKKHRSGKARGNIKQTKIAGNVWKYQTGYGHSTKDKLAFEHPAIMAESLAERHVKSWTNEGDIVLDPFCGSGTTLKIAYLLGRQYIGIDISNQYCELSEKRILHTKQKLGRLSADEANGQQRQLGLFAK